VRDLHCGLGEELIEPTRNLGISPGSNNALQDTCDVAAPGLPPEGSDPVYFLKKLFRNPVKKG
jgi:hypothetical protein